MKLRVSVPASTSNLGSGFDCLGLALDWRVEYDVETGVPENAFHLKGPLASNPDLRGIPAGETNLFFQAAEQVARFHTVKVPPLRVTQRTALPIARGLGSSAAAIAAGLAAANRVLNCRMTPLELFGLGLRIERHPDNLSACLLGGLTVSGFDGKIPFARRFPLPAGWRAAVLVPSARTETKASRRILPQRVHREDAVFNLSRTALLLACLLEKDAGSLRTALQDRLHQPFRFAAQPALNRVYAAARSEGLPVFLSGSGPTLALLGRRDLDKQAKRLIAIAHELEWDAQIRTVGIDSRGAVVQQVSR